MLLNVLDFPPAASAVGVQAAFDAASNGDRIYFPAGWIYSPPANMAWKVTKSLEIFGDGPGRAGSKSGTWLTRSGLSPDSPIFEFTPAAGASDLGPVFLHDLQFLGKDPVSQPTPDLSPLKCTLSSTQRIQSLRIERVVLINARGPALALDASPGTIDMLTLKYVFVSGALIGSSINSGLGIMLKNVSLARLDRCGGGENVSGWLKAESCGVSLYVTETEHNATDSNATQGEVLLQSCTIAHVDSCRFERFYEGPKRLALEFVNVGGAALAMCNSFVKPNTAVTSTGIKITGIAASDNVPVSVFPNNFIRVYGDSTSGGMVDALTSHQGCVIFPQFDAAESQGVPSVEGQIKLPSPLKDGLMAIPQIPRSGPLANATAGLIVPSGASLPTTSVQNGMLFYRRTPIDDEDLYVRINGAWRRIVALP